VIVCQCSAVSDREVRSHAERGVRCLDELGEHCAAAQLCGGCRPTIEALLAHHAGPRAALAG